jgi:hypothetical protein
MTMLKGLGLDAFVSGGGVRQASTVAISIACLIALLPASRTGDSTGSLGSGALGGEGS